MHSIVIVNWNSGRLLSDCLAPLLEDQRPARGAEVVVVDNASTDGSLELIVNAKDSDVTVLRNVANRGFAAACNQGARSCSGEYILFLNPDVRVDNKTVEQAREFLENGRAAGIGIVGIRLVNSNGSVQRSCTRFPTPRRVLGQSLGLDRVLPSLFPPHFMLEWDHGQTRDVDQVMGAFLMMSKAVFEKLGGFDERFFVYFEDVDLCLRARAEGYRVVHFAKVSAVHEGQGTTRNIKDVRLFYLLRSRLLYAKKHFSHGGFALVLLATLIFEPLSRVLGLSVVGKWGDVTAVVGGYRLLLASLPCLLFNRKCK